MKKLISIIILALSINMVSAQENHQVVKKKVLFIQYFAGEYRFSKSTGEEQKTSNMQLDQFRLIMLPYVERPDGSHWPFREYLIDMGRKPFIYLYKDFFLSSHSFGQEYRSLIKEKEIKHINLFEALPVNKTFITEIYEHDLARIWIVEAEWVQIPFKEKTTSMKGIMPNTLVFDDYNIYILKNILTATPVDSTFTGPVARNLEYRTDIY